MHACIHTKTSRRTRNRRTNNSKWRRCQSKKQILWIKMWRKKGQRSFGFAPLQHFWPKNAPSKFGLFHKVFKMATVCFIRFLAVRSHHILIKYSSIIGLSTTQPIPDVLKYHWRYHTLTHPYKVFKYHWCNHTLPHPWRTQVSLMQSHPTPSLTYPSIIDAITTHPFPDVLKYHWRYHTPPHP